MMRYLVVMAWYSHKGDDTIRYYTKYRDMIWYDTIQKCFTVCKNRMLSVKNYSYIVAAPPIFTAPTRSFEVGHGPTSRAAPPKPNQNRSLLLPQGVIVNATFLTKNGTIFACFYFLIAYTASVIFCLLLDHVIRSSAINLTLHSN